MNLLSLEDWRRIMGLHPYYFYNLTTGGVEPIYPNNKPSSVCLSYVRKYAWQGADMLGREDIEQAIETAEKKLRDYLGFSIAPQYEAQTVPWPTFYDHTRTRFVNSDPTGHFIGVRLPNSGYTQALGVERLTLIGTVTTLALGGLVFSDADGDGLNDTFTITIATSVTDPDKLAVYFAAADRLDSEAVDERWRIRPVKVSIAAGTATIKGRYWLLAKPIKYEGVLAQPLDPTVLTNFVDSLLVYERTTDPDGVTVDDAQATVIWETRPCGGWWCCGCASSGPSYLPPDSSHDPGAQGMAIARAGVRDAKMGSVIVGEAVLDVTTGVWSAMNWAACSSEPDRVTVRHYSGYPLENGNVSQRWQTIVARMAAAEMTKPICACDPANKQVHQWAFDLARTAGNNDERFAVSAADLDNPFGTRRGQVEAWKAVRAWRLTPGVIDH